MEEAYKNNRFGQLEWEFKQLIEALETDLKPKITVELGTCTGATAQIFSMVTSSQVVTVDQSRKFLAYSSPAVTFVEGDTHDLKTVEVVKQVLEGPIDFLFIDAGHNYAEVKQDYDMWSSLVRLGGWIAFHDIDPKHVAPWLCQVPRFWAELNGHKTEWIQTKEHTAQGYKGTIGCGGIGLLRV